MRLGVLDIGSNTVHMLVVDAYPGARPLPAFSHKVDLSLADEIARLLPNGRRGEWGKKPRQGDCRQAQGRRLERKIEGFPDLG